MEENGFSKSCHLVRSRCRRISVIVEHHDHHNLLSWTRTYPHHRLGRDLLAFRVVRARRQQRPAEETSPLCKPLPFRRQVAGEVGLRPRNRPRSHRRSRSHPVEGRRTLR